MWLKLALVVIVKACVCECANWQSVSTGELPPNAVSFEYRHGPAYFCKATEDGKSWIGWISPKDPKHCRFSTDSSAKAVTSDFSVLTVSPDQQVHWVYQPWAAPPEGTVACQDSAGAESCFLGRFEYSDGLCEEALGKIDLGSRMATSIAKKKMKVVKCPFYTFLVIK